MPVASEMPKVNATTVAVDCDILKARNVAGVHGTYDVKAEFGDGEAGGAAEDGQQNAFGEQLPHQPLPSGAQSGADGDFLLAAGGAREQKVRDVGAGDQQHQRHRAHQHKQRAADVSHHLFLQANDVHAEGAVALVLFADAAGDDVDIRLRLRNRDAGLQAAPGCYSFRRRGVSRHRRPRAVGGIRPPCPWVLPTASLPR